ncbi:17200_t:CDS:2, partial [Acaulospora morrowiae]
MRDQDGNALKNAHFLGFFRRICKLLFFNIKPVFVFDGGAPELKRATLTERRKRRVGTANNLQKTAEKILAAQMRIRAIQSVEKSNNDQDGSKKKDVIDDDVTYYDEIKFTSQRRKKDEYDLPPISGNM